MSVLRRFGAGEAGFEAYLKRQFVTESININSLADHHIWSTIKTLPATLPEPSFKDEVSSAGVTEAVCQSDLDIGQGVVYGDWEGSIIDFDYSISRDKKLEKKSKSLYQK